MGSQRQLSKLSSREAILLSGAKCFMERGYSATSIDEIAERINATKGMVYHYYGSKAELFFEVHQRGMDALFEAVEPLAKTEQSGKDRFYAMALAHVSTLLETQPFQRAMSEGVTMHLRHGGSEAQRQQLKMLQTRRNAYETMFLQVLNEGIEDGTLISQVPRVAIKPVFAGLNSVIVWYQHREDEPAAERQQLIETVVDTVLGGVLA